MAQQRGALCGVASQAGHKCSGMVLLPLSDMLVMQLKRLAVCVIGSPPVVCGGCNPRVQGGWWCSGGGPLARVFTVLLWTSRLLLSWCAAMGQASS